MPNKDYKVAANKKLIIRGLKLNKLVCVFLLCLIGCAPVTRQASIDPHASEVEKQIQHELALRQQLKNQLRVISIANRISHATAPYCQDKVSPNIGIIAYSNKQINADMREAATRLWGVGDRNMVVAVIPGSPADKAGIKVGDAITVIDNKDVKPDPIDLKEYFPQPYTDAQSVSMRVMRNDAEEVITVSSELVCDYPAVVVNDPNVNAYADGNRIIITTGMLRFAENDDELATVIGHELAHNQMGHIKKKSGNRMIGTLLGALVTVATGVDVVNLGANIAAGAFSQEFEAEADYVGIYNSSRAGYDMTTAPNFWRRMGVEHPKAISHGSSHPSTANRFVALDNAVNEINEKKLAGHELVPNLK